MSHYTYLCRQLHFRHAPLVAFQPHRLYARGLTPVIARRESRHDRQRKESNTMLKLAIIFFIISVIAGALGFTNIAAGARGIAKIFFFIFLALFLIVLNNGVMLWMLVF